VPEQPLGTFYRGLRRTARFKLWWRRRAKTNTTVVVVAGVVIAVGVAILQLPRPRLHEVSGRVECLSGRQVTGVWVQDLDSNDSWWAAKQVDPRARNAIGYDADIRGEHYQLHVGCGGTVKSWAAAPWSVDVSGTTNDFVCYDAPDAAHFDTCQSTP
jgi:hypothetical protein